MARKKVEDPVDKMVGLVDSGLGLASKLVGKKFDAIQADAERRVEEVKEEVIETAYEAKRALVRTMVEGILLSTGLLCLIGGILLYFRTLGIPVYQILVAYGFIVTIYTLLKMKTSP